MCLGWTTVVGKRCKTCVFRCFKSADLIAVHSINEARHETTGAVTDYVVAKTIERANRIDACIAGNNSVSGARAWIARDDAGGRIISNRAVRQRYGTVTVSNNSTAGRSGISTDRTVANNDERPAEESTASAFRSIAADGAAGNGDWTISVNATRKSFTGIGPGITGSIVTDRAICQREYGGSIRVNATT